MLTKRTNAEFTSQSVNVTNVTDQIVSDEESRHQICTML